MDILESDSRELAMFLRRHPRVMVLTGAGVSADSGIPTYRDASGRWRHNRPVEHREFLCDDNQRRRYWARSWYGWPGVRDARPNPAHLALAKLEHRGRVELLVTQNVDRLHQRAGSRRVVDLHGRLDRVRCLGCATLSTRDAVQAALAAQGEWTKLAAATPRPDGDADIADELTASIDPPQCDRCGGDLMPDVVFFGGSVPRMRVLRCQRALERADALLTVGSSLRVFSGFRFCRQAAALGKPIVVVNPGATRADSLADLKLQSPAGPLLSAVERTFA